jgi:hypothetical protein
MYNLRLQVVVDLFRLADQVRHMLVAELQKTADYLGVFLELLHKSLVFLVAPGTSQQLEVVVKLGEPIPQVRVELLQCSGELTEFFGVHYGLWHGRVLQGWVGESRIPALSSPLAGSDRMALELPQFRGG